MYKESGPMPELPTGQFLIPRDTSTSQPNADPGATKDNSPGSSGPWHMNSAAAAAHRFTIEKLHAKGGLGQVSRALDGQLKRTVALKEIRPECRNDESRRRFVTEAEIIGQLEHPGIVPIYALELDGQGEPYYAMRFIQGHTFSEAIQAHRQQPTTLSFRELLQRFISVCQTVAFAHSQAIIHRDLKPANILLGQFGETLVVDWGVAKRMNDEKVTGLQGVKPPRKDEEWSPWHSLVSSTTPPTSSDATQPGQVLGTPAYMAPEQARGESDQIGPAADIFGLGAMLYELLTGKPPFWGQTGSDALVNASIGVFPPPRDSSPGVPKALEAICLKAMQFRPEDRYRSAQDIAADLAKWLADEPVSVYAEPWSVRVGRWIKRKRTLVTGADRKSVV